MCKEKAQENENKPYVILQAESPEALEWAVLSLLKRGYVPLGGVQVVVRDPIGQLGSGVMYFQTMIL